MTKKPMTGLTMKKLLIILLALIAAIAIFFMILGFKSQTGEAPGLANNQLQKCPDTPNCVTSEIKIADAHFVSPLDTQGVTTKKTMQALTDIILKAGGKIQTSNKNYIAATFSSAIFQFVDDFEIRVDAAQQKVHFRSASRVGKSDLGANLKRVNKIKERYNKRDI